MFFEKLSVQRRVDENQVCWFRVQDVLKELDLTASNATKFLERHVCKEFKRRFHFINQVGRPSWYVNEAGAYQLAFAARSDRAIAFQEWFFKTVLPQLSDQIKNIHQTTEVEEK